MSTKTKLVFQSILIILKNATIIIPILEGIVEAIYNVKHPETEFKKDYETFQGHDGSYVPDSIKKGE